jgi:hypothetical protein
MMIGPSAMQANEIEILVDSYEGILGVGPWT